MLKYSIGWRPSIWGGGRLFRPLLRLFLTFLSQFFCKMSNFYMSPSQRKKLGFENSFYPSEIGRYFLVFFLCTNWGCFAWIEVILHRLRLFCTDWGCSAQIEVAPHRLRLLRTDWGCPAPILIEFESMKLFCCERRNSGLEGYMLKHFWEVPKREDQVGTWINTKSISTVWRISEVKKWLISEYAIDCPWPRPG